MSSGLAETPLYAWHAAHGGRIVDFAGWAMPVQYQSIVAEHQAARSAVGLFDISHMGRLRFAGPGAAALLDSVVSRDIARLNDGRIVYALVTRDDGGVLDDVLVYRLSDRSGQAYYLMVVNAGNRTKIVEWIERRGRSPQTVDWSDVTDQWAMIAVQGPRAAAIVQPLVDVPLGSLGYYAGREARIGSGAGIVSRTGYTGEDGFELIVGTRTAGELWQALAAAAAGQGGLPCGLGCRDTLRIEAGMPLYGHELDESIDPFTAGLGLAVRIDKADYPGRTALAELKSRVPASRRVGLLLEGKRVPREGHQVLSAGRPIGRVTSGTFSPTLGRPIAMAFLASDSLAGGNSRAGAAAAAGAVEIDIRGRREPAQIVPLPFYRRSDRKGSHA